MANVRISQLPTNPVALTGAELVPVVQNGQTVQTTVSQIQASPTQTQSYLTINNEPTLPNSEYFGVGLGLGYSSTGPQGKYAIFLNATAASLENAGYGILVKTTTNTVTPVTLQVSGNGLSLTNGSGVAGNPTFALSGNVANLAGASGTGFVAINGTNSLNTYQFLGTTNQITVANGNGVGGSPTIGLANNPVLPGTAGVVVPAGTTAQRGVGSNGELRYNTDTATLEAYANNAWGAIVSGSGVSTFSAGTTGFTPNVPTSGGVVLAGTLNAANGGTGAAGTLTGYVYGNGTSAMTASTTIPTTALSGTITNAQLANSSLTINSTTISLGGSATITAAAPYALTIASGLTGTPSSTYNGSAAVSLSIATQAGITPGTYGSALAIPQVTVNSQGIVTGITTIASGATTYQGTWNAATNTPTLTSSVGTNGYYYVVSTAGTTTLNGISLWSVGDWAVFNGSVWEKVLGSSSEAFNSITVTGLTGYMYGNGTSAVTASTTIPTSALSGQVALANGGTNANLTATAGGVIYSSASAFAVSAAGSSGQVLTSGGTGAPTWSSLSSIGVTTFSGGTTGLTPASATSGAITLAGTLGVGNGGTGLTSLATGALYYGAGGSTALNALSIGSAGQVLTVNSGANAPQWTTLSGVAVTTLSFGTTGLTPSTATSGAITVAGTLAVANGGTGVTSSSGANSVVLRDANANIIYNNEAPGYTNTVTAAGTTTLTAASTRYQHFSGTTTQTLKFPDETTVPAGLGYIVDNDSSANVTVQDSAGNTLATAVPGGAGWIYSLSNSAATGNWAGYILPPGNSATGLITWGTAGLNLASSYIQGVTTLNMSGQLTSTVATGTAPFVVASTTQVANLNAATAGTATNATNVALTAGSGATNYLHFSASATGNQPVNTNSSLTYNYTNNTLTAGINGGTF